MIGARIAQARCVLPVPGAPDEEQAVAAGASPSAVSRGAVPGDLIQRGGSAAVVLVGESDFGFGGMAFALAGLQDLQAVDEGGVPALAPLAGVAPVDEELPELGLDPGAGHPLLGGPGEHPLARAPVGGDGDRLVCAFGFAIAMRRVVDDVCS